ncbi:hypothetical protein MMC30_006532 [Trapelia coarctata]|nr:hypothetical protein [Trapelia coarctata]
MLNALRRGPTSVTRSLIALSTPVHCTRHIPYRLSANTRSRLHPTPLNRSFHSIPQWRRQAAAAVEAEQEELLDEDELEAEDLSHDHDPATHAGRPQKGGLVTKFQELADQRLVSKTLVKTLTEDMKLETMTQVQSMTINETLKGIDVLAQARTGTGKTLAFLIPVLQNIISYDPRLEQRSSGRNRSTPTDIRAIIVSPTRELAEQIAVEAQKVTRNTGVIVQTAVGGTGKAYGLRKIKNEGCHILIGTPGRLNDILSDPHSEVRAPNLSAFVLDEADRLLDQGFAPEIANIQKCLPDRRDVDRQTLLFSATVPEEVMEVVKRTMKRDFKFVRTVQPGEQQTHEKVPQKIVQVAGFENLMPALVELCQREIARKDRKMPFKAIVYFNATAEARLALSILENLKSPGASQFDKHPFFPTTLIQMHSRLTQQQRTRNADLFRRAQSSIMLSSDVTARGMDFPNVTHVIQMMLPTTRDTYIHRVGRTARGDKTGEGYVFITHLETSEARRRLNKLPLQHDDSLATAKVDMTQDAELAADVAQTLTQVVSATKAAGMVEKGAAYLASLGAFSWYTKKQELLDAMNNRSKYGWGLATPPAISPSLVSKLNLSRLNGINIGEREPRPFSGNSRDSSDSGGFSRGSNDRGGFSRGGGSSRGSGGFGGRGGSSGGFSRDRGSSSGYGRDRGSSSGYGRDRGSSSGYGRDRGSSSGYGRDRGGSSGGRREY